MICIRQIGAIQVSSQLVPFASHISVSLLDNFSLLNYSSQWSINYIIIWRRNMTWHTSAKVVAKAKHKTSSWWPTVLAQCSFRTRIDKHKLTYDTQLAIDLRLWFSITESGSLTTGPLFPYHISFPSCGFWFLLCVSAGMTYGKGTTMIYPRETHTIVN